MNGLDKPKPKAKPRVEQNRVLVTGGAGFVGSHLCTFLVERGDQVRGEGRPEPLHLRSIQSHATYGLCF